MYTFIASNVATSLSFLFASHPECEQFVKEQTAKGGDDAGPWMVSPAFIKGAIKVYAVQQCCGGDDTLTTFSTREKAIAYVNGAIQQFTKHLPDLKFGPEPTDAEARELGRAGCVYRRLLLPEGTGYGFFVTETILDRYER